MKNLIPHFIYENYKNFYFKGRFEAVTMFVDISGFTQMTEQLMKAGREGAEVLSILLDNVFEPLIKSVYDSGGFISGFAGDAFTAIFHNLDNPYQPILSANHIRNAMIENRIQKTRFGDFDISVKIGLSYGEVEWAIIGADKQRTYFFKGEPINGCAHAEQLSQKMEITYDKELKTFMQKVRSDDILSRSQTEQNGQYFKLGDISSIFEQAVGGFIGSLKKNTVSRFIPEKVLEYEQKGEFRDVVSIFISFTEPKSLSELNYFVINVLEKTSTFGGYFARLDFGDKGSNVLIFFGTPISYEDNIERAINFILSLKKDFKNDFRAGITFGIAYSGFVGSELRSEFTCLGDIVNLSARFMMKAEFGQIWITNEIYQRIKDNYEAKSTGLHKFKGKEESIQVYELLNRKRKITRKLFEGEILGRNKELELIYSYCKPILDGQCGSVLYIYGEPGIGKSRISYEVTRRFEKKVTPFYLQVDSILRNSFNPINYFFNNYFGQTDVLTTEDKREKFENIFDNLIEKLRNLSVTYDLDKKKKKDEIIKELLRTKSILASLIGVRWDNSLYEELDAKGRYENTLFAIKDFFVAHSLLKPVVIVLEDLQWIDIDSKNVFEIVARNMTDYPIVIITTSRYTDEGSKPELTLDNNVIRNEVHIEQLAMNGIKDLAEEQFGRKIDPKLLSYISLKSEGNPFYIEQFSKFLIENKLIDFIDGEYKLLKSNVEIPKGINAVLIARIDRLTFELKETVQLASVLGREFYILVLEELVNVMKYSYEVENTALRDVQINQLLLEGERERLWNALSEFKYIFRHTLLQDAVYQMQLKTRLKKLHKLAGDCIEKIYKENKNYYSDIAFHYENATVYDKAEIYLEKAGDFAKESYQNEHALNIYDRLLKYVSDEEKEIKIQLKEGEILQFVGNWKEAEEKYRTCISRAKDIKNKGLTAESHKMLGNLLQTKGVYSEALILLNKAYELYLEMNNEEGICGALGNIGVVYHRQSEYDKAMEYYNNELKIAEKLKDKNAISSAVGNMGIVYKDKGDFDKAMECYEKQLNIAIEINDKVSIGRAYANIGIVYYFKGNRDKAIEYYQKQLDIASELGNKLHTGNASGNIGVVYYIKGEYDKAIEYYQKNLEIGEELGNKLSISNACGNLGIVYSEIGEYNKAVKYYHRGLDIFEEIKHKQGIIICCERLGNLYLKQDSYLEAEKYYDKAIETSREMNIDQFLCSNLSNKANLRYDMGRYYEARKLNDEATKLADKVNRKDILFNSKILHVKILAVEDKETAINELSEYLNMILENEDTYDKEQKAELYLELYMLSEFDEYREKSKKIYEELYENRHNVIYKENLDELEEKAKKIQKLQNDKGL